MTYSSFVLADIVPPSALNEGEGFLSTPHVSVMFPHTPRGRVLCRHCLL